MHRGTMSDNTPLPTEARVLIADDDPMARAILRRHLERANFVVDSATTGLEAAECFEATKYDAIVTDIDMPGASGVDLLRTVRMRDTDLPVILVTGQARLDSAVDAVTYGALRYLQKPIDSAELLEAVSYAVNVHRLAQLKRHGLESLDREAAAADEMNGLHERFDRALSSLWMAFQPIVSWREGRVVAYEALLRCDEPSFPHPGVVLEAAEKLCRVHELGRHIRARVAEMIDGLQGDAIVFVNLHPRDLEDEQLGSDSDPLSRHAQRVVLEVTERATLDGVRGVGARMDLLRRRGYRIAVDDLGSGYAGLNSFVKLRPEIVKVDMTLVRDIDTDPKRRNIVGSILAMCSSLDVRPVVEGVETDGEMRALVELGADLMQGYVFARPQREVATVAQELAVMLQHAKGVEAA